MSGQRVKEKLANGQTVFGTFFHYAQSPMLAEMLPEEGLDFVVVCVEHNAMDLADYLPLQYALRAKGIACLVRTHGRDVADIRRACDSFPDGVVIPYVEDAQQLRQLVAAAKCRPLQGEGLKRLLADGQWPSDKTRDYVRDKCADTLFCAMIESVAAVENLDAICSIDGIDAVFVGPNDLTTSMGIPEQRDEPAFVEMVQRVIDVAARHGIAAGAHVSKLHRAQRLLQQGGRFIVFKNDGAFIRDGVNDFLTALGGEARAGQQKII